MLGYGVDEVSIISVVSPCGLVSVSSLSYFLSIVSSYKPSHYSFTLSLGERHIKYYFKKMRGEEQNLIKPQQEKARCD